MTMSTKTKLLKDETTDLLDEFNASITQLKKHQSVIGVREILDELFFDEYGQ